MTNEMWAARYVAFKSDPANDEMTDGMWCGQNGLTIEFLKALKVEFPRLAQISLEKRRARYADVMGEVDQAIITKAKEGNTAAAELLYRRFENWSPKIADEASKRNPSHKSFADLVAEEGA